MSRAEEFIKKQSHVIENPISVWISSYNARKAVEIAREETIKVVCEWIKYNNENGGCLFDGWENDLKKHLDGKA